MKAVLQTFARGELEFQSFCGVPDDHDFSIGPYQDAVPLVVGSNQTIVHPRDASWSAFILYTSVRSMGGHICLTHGSALCGIEKRFPELQSVDEHAGPDFEKWLKDNETWICRSCVKNYLSKIKQ